MILALIIIVAGILFYFMLTDSLIQDKKSELTSIMHIKRNQIVNWVEERKSETRYYAANEYFINDLYRYLNTRDNQIRTSLQARLALVQKNHYQRITVISSRGEEILSVGNGAYHKFNKNKADSTFRLKKPWMDELLLDKETGVIHLDFYTPLFKRINNADSSIAVLMFTIDPYQDLYPMVQSWPVKSASAEALLIRKSGNKVLSLIDLKDRPNTALRYEMSMTDDDKPGVKAFKGYKGTFEATDYRDKKVIASSGQIPGTEWFLLIKVDENEIYRPFNMYLIFLGVIILVMLLATGTSIASFARRREMVSFQKQYQLEQEKLALKEHYEYLIKYANDIILLMDYHGHIIDVNDKAVQEYGYTRDELLQMNISDLRSPDIRDQIKSMLNSSNEEGLIYESAHRKKNGEVLNVEVSSRIIEVNNKKFIQNIIRDITERKVSELKIKRLNRVYAILSQVNEVIIRESDQSIIFQRFCNISYETGKFIAVGIGMLNEKTSFLEIEASAGFNEGYFSNLKISSKEGDYGRGPTSYVLRDGKHYVVNDIENNSSMALWKNDALKRGYKSLGSFPLKEGNKTFGAIMFYSAERYFFDDEEIMLLNELANDLSYSIGMIKREKKSRASEEALQKTQLNLRTLAANIPATNIYIFNPQFEVLLSEGEEKKEDNVSPFVFEKGEIKGLTTNLKVKASDVFSGKNFSDEVKLGNKTYSLKLTPVKIESGEIIAGMLVLQNITQLKMFESALLASESRLHGFFNLNNVFMAVMEMTNNDLCILMANKRVANFYSMDTEQIKNKSVLELEGRDFYNYWSDIYRNIKKYRRPVSVEFSSNRHGKTQWFVAEINILEMYPGENPVFSYTAFDITERKIFENDLQKSEERFRSFFESDVIALAYGDIYGSIKYANNKFLSIIGYSRDDFNQGLINWMELTPKEFYPKDVEKLNEARNKGSSSSYTKELFRKDGTRVLIEIALVLSGENKEEVVAFISEKY